MGDADHPEPPRAPLPPVARRASARRGGPAWGALASALIAAALVLGAAALTDHLLLGHGLSVEWWAAIDGEHRHVATTLERRPQLPNERRALARYVQGWNFAREGVPAELFGFRAHVRADLEVPAGGRTLHVDARPHGRIVVDGAPFTNGGAITAGRHEVEVIWEGHFRQPGPQLTWRFCRGEVAQASRSQFCEPIPRGAFVAPRGDGGTNGRGTLWALAALLALALGAVAWRAATASAALRGKLVAGTLLFAILGAGLGLRLVDYDVMPDFRENGDELFAMWNGWQLLEDGRTRGWSLWPNVYDARVAREPLSYFGMDWTVIQPYFEHPPLLHVLVGAATHLGGAEHYAHTKLTHARLVPILLFIPTLLLLFGVARRVDPRGAGPWLACLLYAVTPTIALQTRVVKEEALLGPLGLAAVYAYLRYRDSRRARTLIVAGLCAGLATWAKITGFAFVPAIVLLALADKDWRGAVILGGVGLLTSLGLLLYGAVIDWDAFVFAQRHQGTRPLHFNIFLRWFDVTLINHSVIGRGWILLLWIGTVASHARRRLEASVVVVAPLVFYLAAISIGTGSWTFGWYAVPLFPWLCIGAGRFLADLWERPDLLGGVLAAIFLGLYSANFVFEPDYMKRPENWPHLRAIIAATVTLLFAPYALVQALRTPFTERLARGALVALLAGFVVLSARFVVSYETFFDTYKDFDRDVYFDR